jgi:hypothetical protein
MPMKFPILLSVLLLVLVSATMASAQHEPPGVASTVPNPSYPLRLRVLSADRLRDRFGVHGFGRADLLGPPVRGLDYTYVCGEGFLHNGPADEFYQGRWKKPDQEMEILVQRVGSDHVDKCDIKVTMKAEPYGRYGASSTSAPGASNP